ncbi:hypothetical protein RHGRI_030385 [Rhododendron griersonianum]|uniref:Uncharacterized protein n=1 Tax=Rhododendron griersonianum TaxID=479676 RepID=A0AAV6ISF5_9ERIC|nr:hypothetical protein RHGRI_030385 [Rhododendron griersonianum]
MGGLPQLFDFNQGNMARKVIAQKRQSGGLEAPQNSLELPVETSQSYFADGDNIPYSYEVRSEWSENSYPTEASMKKLINEEISKRPNNRRNAPSVVARLMGMDMLPLETKTESQDAVKRNEKPRTSLQNKENNKKSSSVNVHRNSNSSKQIKETLNMEKIALYGNSSRITRSEKKPVELKSLAVKERSPEGGELQHRAYGRELFPSEQKKSHSLRSSLRSRTLSRDFDISSAPTKIVILRPGIDRISSMDESWVSSSGTSEERGSIEHFLEEVKQRLKYELQGKVQSGNMIRGGGIETPYTEKPSDPKEIAQRIAKQVRENVTRDLGRNLLRSESTRSYRSEIQNNGPGSPEFINRDTRRLLAERLRNVLKGETSLHNPTVPCSSSSKLSCSDIVEDEPEMQTRSFRHGSDDYSMNHRDLSPMNLENSTEVPPSPASVCSSNHEEFWRAADHLKLRRQLNELDSGFPKETIIQEHTLEAEMELEDEAEAYVRDLLVASGLYKGSSEKVLSRWDPFAKPISNRIFEELEESYRNATKKDSEGSKRDNVDHKLLLDLLNEALTIVLGPPVTVSRFRKTADSLLKLVSELKQTAIFSGFASLNDHVEQRIDEFNQQAEKTNRLLAKIGEDAAASLKELESRTLLFVCLEDKLSRLHQP